MSISSETTKRPVTAAIILPCHNHGHCVATAIQSVVDQKYPHTLISAVDDCSSDNSFEVLRGLMDNVTEEFISEDGDDVYIGECQGVPMILARRHENPNQSSSRNVAIKLAWTKADVFFQLDADDLYLPGKIAKSVAVYETDPNYIGLVYSDVIIHDVKDNTYVREFRHPYDRGILEQENMISNAPLMSKMALAYSGLNDPDCAPAQDWDLWLRITENFVAIHIPEALQQYSVTGENCSDIVPSEKWREALICIHTKLQQRKQLRHGSTGTETYSASEITQ